MTDNYSGVFYVFFEDGAEYRLPWDSGFGLHSIGLPDDNLEILEAVKDNIEVNTDANGVIAYSPAGPRFVSTQMDPKVVYLGLKLTFPDAKKIMYRGSLDDLESWNDFVGGLSTGLDEHGEAIVS